jgi:hypothetical protein
MVSLGFFIDIILPAARWPRGRHSLYQNWVPGIFRGGKGGRWGHAVAQLVEALRYKPKRRGFDSQWCHWNFLLT